MFFVSDIMQQHLYNLGHFCSILNDKWSAKIQVSKKLVNNCSEFYKNLRKKLTCYQLIAFELGM